MYSDHLQGSVEREGNGRFVTMETQHSIPASKALDPGIPFTTAVSQQAYTSVLPLEMERSWGMPNLGYTGQYPENYSNEVLNSSVNMDLLFQQWLQRQAGESSRTTSSIEMPAYTAIDSLALSSSMDIPRYTEATTGSMLSPSSTREVLPSTMSGGYIQTYGPATVSSPESHRLSNHGISPTQASQSLPTPTSYYLETPTTTTMAMTYPQPAATFNNYTTLTFPPTTTAAQMDNLHAVMPETLLQNSHEPYPVMQRQVDDIHGYILKTQDDEEYPQEYPQEVKRNQTDEVHIHSHSHDLQTRYSFSLDDLKAVSKQVAESKRKTGPGRKKVKDCTAALMKIPKSESVSRQTSCWRCRRYKKPCNGKGSVCDACVTSGFRIWSSDIGCRKGDMNEFIVMLIPSDVERRPITINDAYIKPASFRQSSQLYPSHTLIPAAAAKGDVWEQFLYKVQSTGIHGPGVLELLQIAIKYQRKFKKPDKVLVGAIRAMSIAADVFKILVATEESNLFNTAVDLNKIFSEARKVLAAAAGQFLRNCLTGRIKHWLPTLLASNINVFAYILIGDAINAIPIQYRAEVWPNIRKTLLDLRQVLYPTARDLLNALSKGSQPLNMSCWDMEKDDTGSGPPKFIRNPEGMRLVDDCEATFDAMKDLQEWRERFSYLLRNDSWMSTQPLAVDLLLISSISRMYITPKT